MSGPTSALEQGSTAAVTVLFVDVVASTATMTRIGDDAADELRRRLFGIYRQSVESNRGTLVKTMGDGAMAVFPSSALQAVHAGMEMVRRADELEPRSQVRVGIASGEVSEEHGDWFGTPVVLASRLCDKARAGQVLCSDGTRTLVGTRGEYAYVAQRPQRLKGFTERVPAFDVVANEGVRERRRLPLLVATASLVVVVLVAMVALAANRSGDREPDGVGGGPEASWERPSYEPVLEERACSDAETAGDTTVQCSALQLPLDRADPNGARLALEVNRVPATAEAGDTPPLVNLSTQQVSPSGFVTRAAADIVQVGIRGSALSNPTLTCPEVTTSGLERLSMPTTQAESLLTEQLDRCHQRLVAEGIDISLFDQLDISDDLRDLAVALGENQLDVVTFEPDDAVIAMVTLGRHPGLIRTLTLFNPLPAGVTDANGRPQSATTRLARYEELCRTASSLCPDDMSLEALLEQGRQELDRSPQVVSATLPDGGSTNVYMNGDRSIEAAARALEANDALPLLASGIRSGNFDAAASFLVLTSADPRYSIDISTLVQQCARSLALTQGRLDTEAASTTTWSTLVDTELPGRCRMLGVGPLEELGAPAVSDTPTLALLGGLNASSVEDWRARLLTLTNRFEVVFPSSGSANSLSGNGCAGELRLQFLRNPTAQLDVEGCTAQDPPIAFVE